MAASTSLPTLVVAVLSIAACQLLTGSVESIVPAHHEWALWASPSIPVSGYSYSDCNWEHVDAHGFAKAEGGSSGTRVNLDLSWDYGTNKYDSRSCGVFITSESGSCSWDPSNWRNTDCHGYTNGDFECVSSACIGAVHTLWVHIIWNPTYPQFYDCPGNYTGNIGSGSFSSGCT